MQDFEIVELYWKRDERAIAETEKKYANYLSKIAYNVLSDHEDSKEMVNETYLRAWNSMPINRPNNLATYLGRITRQLSIDIYRMKNRDKRKNSEFTSSLDEIKEVLSTGNTTESQMDAIILARYIGEYLQKISAQNRVIFICRYYYLDSIKDIADYYGMSQSRVKSILHRTRRGLKSHLEKEGIWL
mgnify:CR=1 FL=1